MRNILLRVPQIQLEDAEYHLENGISFEGSEECVYTWTADLGDGLEVDVKVVDSQDPWCEAVLFWNGSEIYCSEVSESLRGEWYFENDNDSYCIIVAGDEEP